MEYQKASCIHSQNGGELNQDYFFDLLDTQVLFGPDVIYGFSFVRCDVNNQLFFLEVYRLYRSVLVLQERRGFLFFLDKYQALNLLEEQFEVRFLAYLLESSVSGDVLRVW